MGMRFNGILNPNGFSIVRSSDYIPLSFMSLLILLRPAVLLVGNLNMSCWDVFDSVYSFLYPRFFL